MESPDATRDAKAETGNEQVFKGWSRPAPHVHTTKGGAGSTAGATPKKSYRPSSSRPRRAGKKPDHGLH